MLLRVVVSQLDRLHVAVDELGLPGVGLREQLANALQIQLQQRGKHARITDILHENARAHTVEGFVAKSCKRHADYRDVLALQQMPDAATWRRKSGSRPEPLP